MCGGVGRRFRVGDYWAWFRVIIGIFDKSYSDSVVRLWNLFFGEYSRW